MELEPDATEIRALSPDDAQAYKALRRAAADDPEFTPVPTTEQAYSISLLKRVLAPDRNGFLLGSFCRESGDLVGVVGFGASADHQRGTLYGMYVDAACRNRGIGRRLVRALLEGVDVPVIELYVSETNVAAKTLYRNEGFEVDACDGELVRMALTL